MQVAAESSDDEDDDSDIKHELKSFDYNEIRRSSMVNVDENNADYLKNRLKRQETREVVMNDEFERKYAKQPILNMRYEDIFRNKKFDVECKLENPSGSGSVGSSVVEFDPSARREEVYSVVEPGDEDDLLMRLGVDGEVQACLSVYKLISYFVLWFLPHCAIYECVLMASGKYCTQQGVTKKRFIYCPPPNGAVRLQ